MSVFGSKNILLGVTAGIAAYKTAYLVRYFVKAGANVQVIMTPASKEFVTFQKSCSFNILRKK